MKFYKINPDTDFDAICERIGPSAAGRNLMRKKSRLNFIFIEDISSPAANILKQDALSVSAELVTSRDTILGREEKSSALLIVNDAQREILAKKEKAQDFGLKNLAEFLSANFTQNFT
ncbi:MAG: dihydropteroate synthase, partial [Campylobacter sp.]